MKYIILTVAFVLAGVAGWFTAHALSTSTAKELKTSNGYTSLEVVTSNRQAPQSYNPQPAVDVSAMERVDHLEVRED